MIRFSLKKLLFSIVLLILNPLFSQTYEKDSYAEMWSQAEAFSESGLPRSALEVVDNIYHKSVSDDNQPQLIKAILYRIRLKSDFEENFLPAAINELVVKTDSLSEPSKQIVQSVIAELYWRYYQMNRFRFLNRTQTVSFVNNDPETWDLKTLHETIGKYHLTAIQNRRLLKSIPLKEFSAILVEKDESKKYRPTLYDFLAHRALDYFMNDETGLTKVNEGFDKSNPELFSDIPGFITLKIIQPYTPEIPSSLESSLSILQTLLEFHNKEKNPQAVIDVDLKRLEYVHRLSTYPQKDSVYEASLKRLVKSFEFSMHSTEGVFKLAQFLYNQGQLYQPLVSEEHRWDKKEAFALCVNALEKYPDSDGAQKCKALMQEINTPALSFTVNDVNEPAKPILTLMSFQNINKVWFRIIRMDFSEFQEMKQRNRYEEIVEILKGKPFESDWNIQVPNDGDFQLHKAETGLPALRPGFYVMLASSNPEFSYQDHCVASSDFQVSSISYLSRLNKDGSNDFYVLDRTSGQPLSGTTARVDIRYYDYKSREYKTQFWKTFTADKNGYLKIPKAPADSASQSFSIQFSKGTDRLFTETNFYRSQGERDSQRPVITTHFFTDRKIYRPGQTIYFKGIMIESLKNDHKIVAGKPSKITFFDMNGQKISEINVVSGEFGTFNGSFTAPSGTLNGEMRINNETGSVGVSVEEYKLPNFEVTFLQNKEEFKLNETITATGKALAFSGNPVTSAQVHFRVTRNVFYPYRYFGRGYFPYFRGQETEIASGTVTTDDQGEFMVSFKAIPDESIDRKFLPVFHFNVTADVTDINGETRTGQQQVSVGRQSLILSSDVPDQLNKRVKSKIHVFSRNLAGNSIDAGVTVTISKLKEPDKLYRDRLWDQPDVFLMSKEEFSSKFPVDVWKNENDMTLWPVEKEWFSARINPKSDSLLNFTDVDNWPAGKYRLSMVADDKSGDKVTATYFFTVFDESATKPAVNEKNWFTALQSQVEPGISAKVLFGTSEKSITAIYEITAGDRILESKVLNFSRELRTFEIPVLEEYRGDFAITLSFIKDNRIYANQAVIRVPFSNKDLDVTFETFRSQLKPGAQEEWKIRIRDQKGDKVLAELLTTMYDAALDMFQPNSFSFNLYGSTLAMRPWQGGHNFRWEPSRTFYNRTAIQQPGKSQEFDELNWFGYSFYSFYDRRLQMNVPMMADGKTSKETMAMGMADEGSNNEMAVFQKTEESGEAVQSRTSTGVPGFQLRRDFRETAFFYPDIQTDSNGDAVITFTLPESLTQWKLLGIATTKDLKSVTFEKELVSRKELMVVPNQPRFLREGDTLSFAVKIVNLANRRLEGNTELRILDALTLKDITAEFSIPEPVQPFTSEADQSVPVSWKMIVPRGYSMVVYQLSAASGQFTDGMEKLLPVLTNRALVTETLPVWVNGSNTKTFTLKSLDKYQPGLQTTLTHHQLTFELTSNPAWYAVQAMPSIVESTYPGTDHIFSRFYVNSVASFLLNSDPRIKNVIESWKLNTSKEAGTGLISGLEKNQDLKSVALEETPWITEAHNETERKQRLVTLFDQNTLQNQLKTLLKKLSENQTSNGGFVWMEGMRESRYITQLILTGFGRMKQRGMIPEGSERAISDMSVKALQYLDIVLLEDYNNLKKYFSGKLDENHLSAAQIQYLYARSFFREVKVDPKAQQAYDYYFGQSKKYWLKQNNYLQGMIALALYRGGEMATANAILKSLKEKSLTNEEMGMYWRNETGYYWYQTDLETQCQLLEAFEDIAADNRSVEMMKLWLLKQKQTQDWGNDRSTVEAVYALLGRGDNLLENTSLAEVVIGDTKVDPKREESRPEAGTGYYKVNWSGSEVTGSMARVEIKGTGTGPSWGALYWQYFENLDKVQKQGMPLMLDKQLFVVRNGKNGQVLEPVKDETTVAIGDQIRVRIELRVDRELEFVHMKDMRASGFEPVNVISGYRYQDGLGYYESTRDAATHFFFDYLPKGTFVFEYTLIASQKGHFSNGITQIQCLYAPEFSAHSEGVRVVTE